MWIIFLSFINRTVLKREKKMQTRGEKENIGKKKNECDFAIVGLFPFFEREGYKELKTD
jgi:hypothetical protein